MAAFSRLRVLVTFLLLVASTEPSPIQLFGHVDTASLFSRQDTLDSAVCNPSCDLDTCGSSNSCNAISKRDLLEGPFFNSSDTHALGKRIFGITLGGAGPYNTRPTNAEVGTYIPQVWRDMDDAYYQPCLETVSNIDETPVSQQVVFGSAPFQIISGGIHGCTVVVVVSTRAVWMAHFWESYSNGKDAAGNNNDNPNDQAFKQRVLMFMEGQAVPAGTAVSNGRDPYIPPLPNSGINPALFNLPRSDRTNVYIFTPVVYGNPTTINYLKYPNRYGYGGEVLTTITNILGITPQAEIIPYQPLNSLDPADLAILNDMSTSRSFALFQFDPNSNGNGLRAWRLFLENRLTSRNTA